MEHIGNCCVGYDIGEVYAELKQDNPLETKIELHLPNAVYTSTLMEEIIKNSWTWKDAISIVAEYINKQVISFNC